MGRWDQYDKDEYRLPDGITRIGYDGDTQESIFQDHEGNIYRSSPGVEYGSLKQDSKARPQHSRKLSSSSAKSEHDVSLPPGTADRVPPSDPLPPNFESLPQHEFQPDHTPGERFVEAVRKSALPRLQGVVKNLRETVKSHSQDPNSNERSHSRNLSRNEKSGP